MQATIYKNNKIYTCECIITDWPKSASWYQPAQILDFYVESVDVFNSDEQIDPDEFDDVYHDDIYDAIMEDIYDNIQK